MRLVDELKFITEEKMEIASLFIQKVGVVLSSTATHMTVSDNRKALCVKGKDKDIN